jgi:ADP-heptose:LPS heptosyltransferase
MSFRHDSVQRILLVKLRAIGDAVLTLPSLEALHKGFPGAQISVLCPPLAVEVYSEDPRVAEVLPYDKAWFKSLGHHARHAQGLQERHFDLAVCLHASLRSALLGWLSAAPWRSIRNHSGPDWFSNLKASEPKEPKSIIQRDFDAIRALGLQPTDERPRMALAPWAQAEAGKLWKALRLPAKGVLAIFPGAGKAEKRWPLASWLQLAKDLKRKGKTPLLLTAPGEASLAAEAKAVGGRWASVEGLQVLAALCKRSGYALGCDSGPRHIAAAVGAKTLTLFGPETLREWHPYKEKDGHRAIQASGGKMESLAVETVLQEVQRWAR